MTYNMLTCNQEFAWDWFGLTLNSSTSCGPRSNAGSAIQWPLPLEMPPLNSSDIRSQLENLSFLSMNRMDKWLALVCVNQTLATIAANAGLAQSAYQGLQDKIDRNAKYVLEANSEFQTSGYTTSGGVTISNNGLTGRKKVGNNWVNTFAITSNGDASFGGELNAATGTFAGDLDVSGDLELKDGTTSYAKFQANSTLRSFAISSPDYNVQINTGGVSTVYAQGTKGCISLIGTGILEMVRGARYFRISSTGIYFNETPKVGSTAVSLDGHTHDYAASGHSHSGMATTGTTYGNCTINVPGVGLYTGCSVILG